MNGRALVVVCSLALAGCPQAPSSSKVEVLKREGKPDVHNVADGDQRMNAAIQKARDTVQAEFVKRVEAKEAGLTLSFKAKFEAEGEVEHMWVSEPRMDKGQLVGFLSNDPTLPVGVKRGDEVRRDPAEISDWMIVEKGKLIGGFTIRAIRDGMSEAERKQFDASVDFSFD